MPVWFDPAIDYIKGAFKAFAAGIVAGATYLMGVIGGDDTVSEAFNSMTAMQWLGLTISILAAYGIVYRTPNK